MIRQADLNYQTPPGYADESFIYVYDAGALVAGVDYLNLFVDVADTDFVLRKIDGQGSILAGAGSRYQVRDKNQREFYQKPLYPATLFTAPSSRAVLPEVLYSRGSQIGFDLYQINPITHVFGGGEGILPTSVTTAQMLFWGNKRYHRMKVDAGYPYYLKPFSYSVVVTINWNVYTYDAFGVPTGFTPPRASIIPVNNFDFELWGLNVNDPVFGGFNFTLSKLQLYDPANEKRMSNPILTDLLATNSGATGIISAGNAFSPPILYPIGSQIKFDIHSLCFAPDIPLVREYVFFGAQRIPKR